MKKALILAASIVFLLAGWAQASTLTSTLVLGNDYTRIASLLDKDGDKVWDPVHRVLGGGSIDPSTLDGVALRYLYCVDLFRYIYPRTSYPQTYVNDEGNIYGKLLPHAGQVAWLLANYGTGGQGDQAVALQAAIWNVVHGSSVYRIDRAYYGEGSAVVTLYDNMLAALGTGDVSEFLWITPGRNTYFGKVFYQGLVGDPVPIPGAVWLLGTGLVGLAVLRRK